MVPFVTWENYGINSFVPDQVSLFSLFERGFAMPLTVYMIGVTASAIGTAVARRSFFSLGALLAAFPAFIWFVTMLTFLNGSMSYTQAWTIGIFLSFAGSALLEWSYLAYLHADSLPPVGGQPVLVRKSE